MSLNDVYVHLMRFELHLEMRNHEFSQGDGVSAKFMD